MRPEDLELLAAGAEVATGADASIADADVLVLLGGRSGRALRGRGFEVVRYRAFRSSGGHVLHRRQSISALVATVRGRRRRSSDVVAASRVGSHALVPPAVAAAGAEAVERVVLADDDRRRAAFIATDRASRGPVVVKVSRTPSDRGRAAPEQAHLAVVRGVADGVRVPSALGCGAAEGREWAAESLLPGRPLRGHRRSKESWNALDRLGEWLGELAVATAHAPTGAGSDRVTSAPAADAADDLGDVVAVLVHGDLASGENVLVHRRSVGVIDWETAVADGWPLLDLLPTLALGAARLAGCRSPEDQAGEVLALCRGERKRSGWLFAHVERHLGRLGLDPVLAGPLAVVAWGYQASMRARRDELLAAAGGQPSTWTSSAELVLEGWLADGRLGDSWPALTERGAAART